MGMTSVRMPDELITKLENTAEQLRRSKSWLINDAVREYLERENTKLERLRETEMSLADIEAGNLVDGEAVMDWLSNWGEEEEGKTPAA